MFDALQMLEDEGILNRGYYIFCASFFIVSNDVHHIYIRFLQQFVNVLTLILSFLNVCFQGFRGYNCLLGIRREYILCVLYVL